MNMQNLFKKKYIFKKPLEESGVAARPQWALLVLVFLLLLITACLLAYYVFYYVTTEREGVYALSATSAKKIDTDKSNTVLDFFKAREEATAFLKTTPPVFIDPSR